LGRPRPKGQPSSRTGENSPYGMIGGIEGNVGIIRSPVRALEPPHLVIFSGEGTALRTPKLTKLRPDALAPAQPKL
jgi:hypothetical protein